MWSRCFSVVAVGVIAAASLTAQEPTRAMAQDRVTASYDIYSALLPVGESGSNHYKQFLVEEITMIPFDPKRPCDPGPAAENSFEASTGMNPHQQIEAPARYRADLDEVLADFDRHCHERVRLDATKFHAKVPVRALNEREVADFHESIENRSAPKLYGFSQVYFNAKHTMALVYSEHVCCCLCGSRGWDVLVLRGRRWVVMPWAIAGHWVG